MVDYNQIYSSQAGLYDQLVAREDYQGNILKTLRSICSLEGKLTIDLGTGTGRLIRLLSPDIRRMVGTDISEHMLSQALSSLGSVSLTGFRLVRGDNLNLPFRSGAADIALAGWTIGHLTGWYPDGWPRLIGRCLEEIRRIVRLGGTAIILETLGTGRETPRPPTDALAAYYRFLEKELTFSSSWVRTDYRFHSIGEAVRLTGFFFGEEMARKVRDSGSVILPECTGLWWKRY